MRTPRSTEIDKGITFEAHALGERRRSEKNLVLGNMQQCSTRESRVRLLSPNQRRAFPVPVVVRVVIQEQPVELLASSVRCTLAYL